MANSGPGTSGSQFFITYRSCPHLDNKHSIFGSVVGGMETLAAMERVEVGEGDAPVEDITIIRTIVRARAPRPPRAGARAPPFPPHTRTRTTSTSTLCAHNPSTPQSACLGARVCVA